jgi:hypothetical protein
VANLQVTATNAQSVIQFVSNIAIRLSWNFGGVSIPYVGTIGNIAGSETITPVDVDYSYPLPESIGSAQNISLGSRLVYTGALPVAGVEFTIFVRPVLQWTPTLSGGLSVTGSATATPNTLNWTGNTANTQLAFEGNGPVDLSLSNPQLNLQGFRLRLDFPVIIALAPFTAYSSYLISQASYSITSPAADLISFEPNTFALLTRLSSAVAGIQQSLSATEALLANAIHNGSASILSTLPGRIDTLNKSIQTTSQSLQNSLNQMSQSLLSQSSTVGSEISDIRSQMDIQSSWLVVVGGVAIIAICLSLFRIRRSPRP